MSDVNFDFHGRNFAVTGASSGIGKQVVLELLGAGANVLALARRNELMDELYKDYPDQIVTAQLDVRDQSGLDDVLKSFVASKGKFHGSVYAAGITAEFALRGFDMALAHDVMDTNFFGAVDFLRRMTAAATANRGSSNVWIASSAAHHGAKSLSAYSGSKGAMIAAMRALSLELDNKGHRLNSVSPGWIDTEMTRKVVDDSGIKRGGGSSFRIGRPENISDVVMFLLSDRAQWIRGIDIIVDGGRPSG